MICSRYNFVWAFIHLDRIDNRVKNVITLAGFSHVINVEKVDISQHFVSALVESWRTETHISFSTWRDNHYFTGCGPTVRLEIDGLPVISIVTDDVHVFIRHY